MEYHQLSISLDLLMIIRDLSLDGTSKFHMFFFPVVTLGVVSAHRAGDALSHVPAEPRWLKLEGFVVVEGYLKRSSK